jgi:hypothetical protein
VALCLEAVAVSDSSSGEENRALAGAPAPAAPFPRLEEDNCNRKHSRKGRFSAEMNILGYIREHGENNVAELVVTASDCLSVKEFQKKWHSFLTGFLKKRFPSGMWTRERQPRSGNWHAHCAVNLGRDIKTGFPIAEVEAGEYRNVQAWIRALWKELREGADCYGFGRISLLPIKKSGPVAAKYFVKYLAKSHGSVKSDGEERCRLFGTWGTKRWCYARFSWVSNRIFRKRLTWYAKEAGLEDVTDIRRLLGEDWWFCLREPLLRVVMPEEYYQVWDRDSETYRWDELGFRARCEDLCRYPHVPTDYRRERLSRFLFYMEVAKSWGMDAKRARVFARRQLERLGMGYQRLLPFAGLSM